MQLLILDSRLRVPHANPSLNRYYAPQSINKSLTLFHCDRYNNIRQQVTNDIIKKYPKFDSFNNTEKTIFLFNNADTFICKKLGYFTYEALQIRELCNPGT